MPRYHFDSPSSVLDTVTVISTLNGSRRAFLHLRDDAKPEDYSKVMQTLNDQRLLYYPAEYQGKHVLELREIPKGEKLVERLQGFGFVNGAPRVETLQEEQFSTKEKVAHRTLSTAGGLYVVGDLALLYYAIKEFMESKNLAEPALWLGYAGGTQMLLQYGKDQTSTRLQDMTREMMVHMHSTGVDIPPDSGVAAVTRERDTTVVQKVDRFLRRNPSEAMNACFSFAGAMMMVAAQGYTGQMASSIKSDTILGATTMTSGLISMLIHEKAMDPQKKYDSGIGGTLEHVKDYIQSKPLAIAGIGYAASTALHGYSTFKMFSENRTEFLKTGESHFRDEMYQKAFRGIFVITNLMAEFLITVSSKGHGHGVKSDSCLEDSAYAIAADLINRQDPHVQGAAEEHLATFLSHKSALGEDKEKILGEIRNLRMKMKDNPWSLNMPAVANAMVAHPAGPLVANEPNWAERTQKFSKTQLSHAEAVTAGREAAAAAVPDLH